MFLHAPLGEPAPTVGSTVTATGIVGQRESASGLNDGYRLWPRDRAERRARGCAGAHARRAARPGRADAGRDANVDATPESSRRPRWRHRPPPAPSPRRRPHARPPAPPPALTITAARGMAIDAVVTVEGTVTVAPGRILGDRVIAIQDATAGICVRLTADTDFASILAGRHVRVTGKLAAPYANLEVRLSHASDLAVLGWDAATRSTGERLARRGTRGSAAAHHGDPDADRDGIERRACADRHGPRRGRSRLPARAARRDPRRLRAGLHHGRHRDRRPTRVGKRPE